MPSTENTTLQRIQREISDVLEREKELRTSYEHTNGNTNNNNEHETNNNITSPESPVKPVLNHSISTGALNGTKTTNGVRLFTPNPSTKGVMHKFIKSRGKLTTVTGFQASAIQIEQQTPSPPLKTWIIPDVIEPPKVTEPGKCIRKGYVPVQVRMQKELEDLHKREMELRSVRRKSQPDYSDDDLDEDTPQLETTLKAARSMAQLYDPNEYRSDDNSSPAGLKPARSLADLCDASEDELETPGSHSLIMRWEEMIQRNQQESS